MKKMNAYISWMDLRQVCIDNEYFTAGDNKTYERFLNESKYPLGRLQLRRLALRIIENTPEERFEGESEEDTIAGIATMILRKSIVRFEEV